MSTCQRWCDQCTVVKARYGITTGRIVVAVVTAMVSLYALYIHFYNKCDVTSMLMPLLLATHKHFAGLEYFLDYGSLLGATRDHGIIPWEFDFDLSVLQTDCHKFIARKESFAQDGFQLFTRNEFIPFKKSLLMGYDGYLHKACARVYDHNGLYYVDVDQYLRYTYAEAMETRTKALAEGRQFVLPPGYTEADGDLLCNEEAFEGEAGGCRPFSWIYPLKPINLLGIAMNVPNQPERNLDIMYGDDWRIPRPKGYKMAICGWMPVDHWKFALLWIVVTVLPTLIYIAVPWMWNGLLICTGRRNVTHKYANLPLHLR